MDQALGRMLGRWLVRLLGCRKGCDDGRTLGNKPVELDAVVLGRLDDCVLGAPLGQELGIVVGNIKGRVDE